MLIFVLAALKNVEISGCDAPENAGMPKMFVFSALENAESFQGFLVSGDSGAPKHTGFSRMSGFLN